jgi:hypothetical protein
MAYVKPGRAPSDHEIARWLESVSASVRAAWLVLVVSLQRDERWVDCPYVKPLKGAGKGLIEFIFLADRVQWRPLGFYGPDPHEVTLLIGASKKGKIWTPRDAIETAQKRKDEVKKDRERIVDYEFP